MQWYRCKCGYESVYGSVIPQPCEGCDKCGTTLAMSADGHREVEPHEMSPEVAQMHGHTYHHCKRCGYGKAVADPTDVTRRLLFESARWDHAARHGVNKDFWECDEPVCSTIAEHLKISNNVGELDADGLFGGGDQWRAVEAKLGAKARGETN